jgi:hypothetical protein
MVMLGECVVCDRSRTCNSQSKLVVFFQSSGLVREVFVTDIMRMYVQMLENG